ncbi:serine/arginine-rich splicing factor 2-like [Ruditapes philippinarum]|uniref:serine/arginine-rich splicing factor 2-like n=1 Tax=Ruditapes philippinarum TaxID=129788 RepID=UPI00295AA765|nr:serine/arginine-rich splicing factor 2-like [Ruditapes philippinarum]
MRSDRERKSSYYSQRRRSRSRSRSRRPRSRSRSRCTRDNCHSNRCKAPSPRSRSRCTRDKCHSNRSRTPSPNRSRDIRPSGSGTSSLVIKIDRISSPAREEVPLLLDQLNEPEFPELFGTHEP